MGLIMGLQVKEEIDMVEKKAVIKTAKTELKGAEVERDIEEWIGLVRMSQSSVEIIQDAKGAIKATVKAYADSSDEAAEAAVKTFKKLLKDLGI